MNRILLQAFETKAGKTGFRKAFALPRSLSRPEDFASLIAKNCGPGIFTITFSRGGENEKRFHRLCDVRIRKNKSTVSYAFLSEADELAARALLSQNANRARYGPKSTDRTRPKAVKSAVAQEDDFA